MAMAAILLAAAHVQQLDLFSPESFPERLAQPRALPPHARWRCVATPCGRIEFILRRSRRRSIGLTIDALGLTVTAPHWTTLSQIDAAVLAKARWIVQKLAQQRQRRLVPTTGDGTWRHQSVVQYFGQPVRLFLGADAITFEGEPFKPQAYDALHLPLPHDAEPERVRDAVHGWLQQQAHAWFGERLQWFLAQSQQRIRRWRLSCAATRWGSCSSQGTIMLNWRLIHFSHAMIDYVIAHEIAHLREMNHSQVFWDEVGRILPGFEAARQALRQVDMQELRAQ